MSDKDETIGLSRRAFLRGASVATVAGATGGMLMGDATPALANRHRVPNPCSVDFLDRNSYIHNMQVIGHLAEGGRTGKMQMLARGEERFLFQGGTVIDVTHADQPQRVNVGGFQGGQLQLAYNKQLRKWILITSAEISLAVATPNAILGKYDDPTIIDSIMNRPGLRGIRIYDATDPLDIRLISTYSVDGGDPSRTLQTGSGPHRNYYDGGRYAYLDSGFDNTFTHMELPWRVYTNGFQIVDLADPANPQMVSNWWVPGMRVGEEAEYEQWREHGDQISFTSLHGPIYVPERVEDGGRYGYGAWGSFGVMIHDVSDPTNPRLVGKLPNPLPDHQRGGIPFHTIWVGHLRRGFVIGNPEPLNPDCNEPFLDTYVVDVRDPANPRVISTLPRPVPPEEAPYPDFCCKRGRHGTHNPPHIKAPGHVKQNFICYAWFTAGLRCYDIANPRNPRETAYFIPPQGGNLNVFGSGNRNTDNVFVEWDRNLIYAATDTGLYVLATPALGPPKVGPRRVQQWALKGLNEGHDD